MEMALAMRQLHARGPACRGLAVDSEGVIWGTDHVLVRCDPCGYRVVDFDDTVRLLKFAFGERYDIGHLRMQFKGIERALNDGNLVKAQILGLQTSLAQIGGAELALLERAAALLKYDPAQPRDNNGRWTTGDGGTGGANGARDQEALQPSEPFFPEVSVSSPSVAPPAATPAIGGLAPEVLGLLGRFVAAISAPLALGSLFALIPTNGNNIHQGDIPGRADLSYRSDEGVLTIFRQDDQGNIQRVYEGFPDSAGLYRDSTGRVIGQQVGTGTVSVSIRYRFLAVHLKLHQPIRIRSLRHFQFIWQVRMTPRVVRRLRLKSITAKDLLARQHINRRLPACCRDLMYSTMA